MGFKALRSKTRALLSCPERGRDETAPVPVPRPLSCSGSSLRTKPADNDPFGSCNVETGLFLRPFDALFRSRYSSVTQPAHLWQRAFAFSAYVLRLHGSVATAAASSPPLRLDHVH